MFLFKKHDRKSAVNPKQCSYCRRFFVYRQDGELLEVQASNIGNVDCDAYVCKKEECQEKRRKNCI